MSYQIFQVFFLLFLVCCKLWRQECLAQNDLVRSTDENTIADFFKLENDQIKYERGCDGTKKGDGNNKIDVKQINLFFFVAVDGMMVALAEVSDSEQSKVNEKINVLAKNIKIDEKLSWNAIENGEKWTVQLATDELGKEKTETVIKSVAAVVRDKTIYYITVTNDTLKDLQPSELSGSSEKWNVKLVEGESTEVDVGGGMKNEKAKRWTSSSISAPYKTSQGGAKKGAQQTNIPPSDGFAFVAGDKNTIFFVIKGKETTSGGRDITAVFELEESSSSKKLNLLPDDNIVNCYPSFFQWNKKTFMTSTVKKYDCSKTLKEFDASKKKFINSNSSISRLRDFLKNKNNFATANINENDSVLLFTQQHNADEQGDVYLWITDGTRVGYVGTIDTEFKGLFYGSILYKNDELLVLHKKSETLPSKQNKNVFTLTRLHQQLVKIRGILNDWQQSDDSIENLCKSAPTIVIPCFTNGLVGFLSKNDNGDTTWQNAYLNVSANVKKGTKYKNGFSFTDKDAGATWLVNKENVKQPYNFNDFGFTLVATVKIDKNDEVFGNSLLGLGLDGETKHIGVLCNKEKKWALIAKDSVLVTTVNNNCEKDNEYSVALVLNEDKVFVYIDWEEIILFNYKSQIMQQKEEKITHFYFGSDSEKKSETLPDAKTDVTITNVLLYNRPFTEIEIQTLKLKHSEKNRVQARPDDDDKHLDKPKEKTTNTGTQPDTQVTQKTTEQEDKQSSSPPPPTTEDGAARVGVVGVLCFMLFGVFTLLGRYVH